CGMRSLSVIVTLVVLLAPLSFVPSTGAAAGLPKYSVVVEAGVGAKLVFAPARIVLPQVLVILNVTLFHNGSAEQRSHTFTINDQQGVVRINVNLTEGQTNWTEFIVQSAAEFTFNNKTFTAQLRGGGIYFYCDPHEEAGMVGAIVIGTEERAIPELGLFLRAYWIGLIGLAAMLVWIGITYFIIKSSSRHLTDHREHVRRGLP
ncbi:MAG: plastocyanin/azurin family copper-binding protein, partial [Candidatus Thermoplasmatota archaeon]